MKILVVIAHYFKAEENARHASLKYEKKEQRQKAVFENVLSWRTHWGSSISNGNEHGVQEKVYAAPAEVDIVIATNSDNHCLTHDFLSRFSVHNIDISLDNPRMLPFASQAIFKDNVENYDWFVYCEDDVALHDPFFFHKMANFQSMFGYTRLLQPNRYEINTASKYLKTYIDGDILPEYHKVCSQLVPDEYGLLGFMTECGPVRVVRANNPHAGCYALSNAQMRYWISKSHFLDMDCSFVSPLESAATLGLMKTFSIFKTDSSCMNYLEIEHLDQSYS